MSMDEAAMRVRAGGRRRRRRGRTVQTSGGAGRGTRAMIPHLSQPRERIGPLLVADRRDRAVTGVDDRVVGELEEFFVDAAHQQLAVAAGEVGTADAATEEDVAAEHQRRLAAPEEDDV